MMTDAEHINWLCKFTLRANTLNALHACRPDHPLGRGNAHKWRNAMALVTQRGIDFIGAEHSIRWLEGRAREEQIAEIANKKLVPPPAGRPACQRHTRTASR